MQKISLLAALLLVITAFSQTEYPRVMDNGGGKITTASYQNLASIGQSVIGICSDATKINQAGYITTVSVYVGIEEKPQDEKNIPEQATLMDIFPNPFNKAVNIKAPDGSLIDIFDTRGHLVAKNIAPGIWRPDKAIHSGVLLIKAKTPDDNILYGKVIFIK